VNQDMSTPPAAPQQKPKSNTLLIVVVVLIVICCLCACVGALGWQYGDSVMQTLGITY
jgi:type IV secretory pathway VirB2 component (pilin)